MEEWYAQREGAEPIGPVSLSWLAEMVSTGKLGPRTLVARRGSQDWVPLELVPEFAGAMREALPPAPMPPSVRPDQRETPVAMKPLPLPRPPVGPPSPAVAAQPPAARAPASTHRMPWGVLLAAAVLLIGLWIPLVVGLFRLPHELAPVPLPVSPVPVMWEYDVRFVTNSLERLDSDAMKPATVTPATEELNALGKQGWELVSAHVEMETAFPNFGNEKLVTGIQPNVRPQRLVLIFKRPLVEPEGRSGAAPGTSSATPAKR